MHKTKNSAKAEPFRQTLSQNKRLIFYIIYSITKQLKSQPICYLNNYYLTNKLTNIVEQGRKHKTKCKPTAFKFFVITRKNFPFFFDLATYPPQILTTLQEKLPARRSKKAYNSSTIEKYCRKNV